MGPRYCQIVKAACSVDLGLEIWVDLGLRDHALGTGFDTGHIAWLSWSGMNRRLYLNKLLERPVSCGEKIKSYRNIQTQCELMKSWQGAHRRMVQPC